MQSGAIHHPATAASAAKKGMAVFDPPQVQQGCLSVEDVAVLEGVDAGAVAKPLPGRSAAFVITESQEDSSGLRKVLTCGKLVRGLGIWCMFQDENGWVIPRWASSGADVPPETQLLLLEARRPSVIQGNDSASTDADVFYVLLLPVNGGDCHASLQGSTTGELQLCVESGVSAVLTRGALFACSGDNPYELIRTSIKLLADFKCAYNYRGIMKDYADGLQFAPLGVLDMQNSDVAFNYQGHVIDPSGVSVRLKVGGCGQFEVYSSKRPQLCTVDAFMTVFDYSSEAGLLMIIIPPTASAQPSKRNIQILYSKPQSSVHQIPLQLSGPNAPPSHMSITVPVVAAVPVTDLRNCDASSSSNDHNKSLLSPIEDTIEAGSAPSKFSNSKGYVLIDIESTMVAEAWEHKVQLQSEEMKEDRNRESDLQLKLTLGLGGAAMGSLGLVTIHRGAGTAWANGLVYVTLTMDVLTLTSMFLSGSLITSAVKVAKDRRAPDMSPWVWRLIEFGAAAFMVSFCIHIFMSIP